MLVQETKQVANICILQRKVRLSYERCNKLAFLVLVGYYLKTYLFFDLNSFVIPFLCSFDPANSRF